MDGTPGEHQLFAQPSALERQPGMPLLWPQVPPQQPTRHGSVRVLLIGAFGIIVVLAIALLVGLSVYRRFEAQQAENALLVRQLAAITVERDDLSAAREQLTAELDRVSGELERERARAQQAEAATADVTARLEEANARIAALQRAAEASAAENQRLNDEVATLRARTESARQAASEASATAAAETAARRRAEQISNALGEYADAATRLSRTRDRMIDILLRQSVALRSGQRSEADRLLMEYNSLVPIHNQQVEAANAALDKLRRLL